ncbi:MAG: hypothetical protein D6798_08840 [Deltaproteobacteria bacterium]|nr:MAG: hypothetical protein D6798_08840 [Deltaproteobacteria bacterium]
MSNGATCCRRWRGAPPAYRLVGEDDAKLVEGADGSRLPTEAQWEYASRAGTDTSLSFGDDAGALADHGWYWDTSERKTHPVGQKNPNPWGLHDVYGYVWEWCQDWDSEYADAEVVAPVGPPRGDDRRAWALSKLRSSSCAMTTATDDSSTPP